ncbi:dienelactone hydrolase family protein [Pseudonocardia kunmingensis]|uniref:Carboxymethylenebutenolidase n=1 Tax=Pseudonocardia kunmingensis TaxID=630975 RepID=A0A543DXG1_9PSEU|nr:dienelactone hydrolase family protein [Pseudonocardia kunmingensis]TQM13996.1 carboxymethylenebutenolidase [Pseudonocardia kunmingensis]
MQTEISFPADDGTSLPGVLTVPDAAGAPGPALVMIYEAFGMTDEMRRVARDLAAEGFAVLIPDLFARGRITALCVARAVRTVRRGAGRELEDIEAGRRWLARRAEVDADRIGTIGFCMGGGFALLLAGTGRYKVSAPFYNLPLPVARACPVVASYGGRDVSTRGYPERLEARLDELGVPHDVATYPEAGHSFFTRTPGVKGAIAARSPIHAEYHAESAADAHRRVVAFFREHL